MLPTIATGNVGSALAGEYEVANSCRFNGSNDELIIANSPALNRRTGTFSLWIKRSKLGSQQRFFCQLEDGNRFADIRFTSDDKLQVISKYDGTTHMNFITNRLFRDVSAFYAITVCWDTTSATESSRLKIWINGVQESSFSTASYPSQNVDLNFGRSGTSYPTTIGSLSGGDFFGGYICEVVRIDGTQLNADSFGEFDEDTNIFKPKDVSELTFGTNGFYLDFENSSSLGADVSGNGNNFTVNNLTSIDQTTDTCTNNFATWNPLQYGTFTAGSTTMADGNLTFTSNETGSNYPIRYSTIAVSSGKWYAEFKVVSASATGFTIGISDGVPNAYIANTNDNEVGYYYDGRRFGFSTTTHSPWGNSFTTNDIIGIAMDLDNNKLYFSKNGTYQESGDPTTGSNGITIPTSATGVYHFAFGDRNTTGQPGVSANFGNPPFSISSGNSDGNGYGNFEYSVPSGYYALNTKNLAEFG